MCILKFPIEGTVSQISYLGPRFYLSKKMGNFFYFFKMKNFYI